MIGDARLGELRIIVLRKGWCSGKIEPGSKNASYPISLVHRSESLDGLDGFRRLCAIIVLDKLNFSLTLFELKTAALIHLMGPKPIWWKMARSCARRERSGFCADDPDLNCRALRASSRSAQRSCQRRCGRIFQEFTSSHESLPRNGLFPHGLAAHALSPSIHHRDEQDGFQH